MCHQDNKIHANFTYVFIWTNETVLSIRVFASILFLIFLSILSGQLIPTRVETVGLGGTINITFACSGCQLRSVSFQGSSMVEASRRTLVGLTLAVPFIVSGHGFAKFHRTLNQCLGIQGISKNRFYEVVQLIYPHIHDILTEMCNEEKESMKKIDDNVLRSWQRGVVNSDGVWHTRGHFSKNGGLDISVCGEIQRMMICLWVLGNQLKAFLLGNVTDRLKMKVAT